MDKKIKPVKIPFKEFNRVYKKVPRLAVDVIIKTPKGVLLSKRSIEPCKGMWHIPGGTVLFGKKLKDTVKRVAEEEVGIDVTISKPLGNIEYSLETEDGRHTITIVYLVKLKGGKLKVGEQGEEVKFFKKVPQNTIKEQAKFLKENNLMD